jgi:catechol 2,3-dioxygenase-like lactoylglutathione lyase family enzyme
MPETPELTMPRLTLSGIVLDSPDAQALADFYVRLLGWTVGQDEPDWVKLKAPNGGPGLSFQTETAYVPPTWPTAEGRQQMMQHLDIEVDDLDVAQGHALAAGATLADYQPQDDVRVFLDPAGHPFCFFLNGA